MSSEPEACINGLPPCLWEVAKQTVRGASHVRAGTVNQDAVEIRAAPGGLAPIVLAVSDGHGSQKSARSDIGSALAARLAAETAIRLLGEMRGSSVARLKSAAEHQLPAEIVKQWHLEVRQHAVQHPFASDELALMGRQLETSLENGAEIPAWVPMAYGATLLIIAVAEDLAFYLQLGDGDILAAYEAADGEGIEVHHPLPHDESLIANETTSLCMAGASKMFRFGFRAFRGNPPILLLASTDGYSNAFSTPADFEKVAVDIVRLTASEGFDYVAANLGEWLEDASRSGSGDDVTLGIIHRKQVTPVQADAAAAAEPAGQLNGGDSAMNQFAQDGDKG